MCLCVCVCVCVCVCACVCLCVCGMKWAYPYVFVATLGSCEIKHHHSGLLWDQASPLWALTRSSIINNLLLLIIVVVYTWPAQGRCKSHMAFLGKIAEHSSHYSTVHPMTFKKQELRVCAEGDYDMKRQRVSWAELGVGLALLLLKCFHQILCSQHYFAWLSHWFGLAEWLVKNDLGFECGQ